MRESWWVEVLATLAALALIGVCAHGCVQAALQIGGAVGVRRRRNRNLQTGVGRQLFAHVIPHL